MDNNHFLGRFDLLDITQAPRGQTKIDVSFKIDNDGLLTVVARETSSGKEKSIQIEQNKVYHKRKDVEKVLEDAQKNLKKDQEIKEQSELYLKLSYEISIIRGQLKQLDKRVQDEFEFDVDDMTGWFVSNRNATIEQLKEKDQQIKGLQEDIANYGNHLD